MAVATAIDVRCQPVLVCRRRGRRSLQLASASLLAAASISPRGGSSSALSFVALTARAEVVGAQEATPGPISPRTPSSSGASATVQPQPQPSSALAAAAAAARAAAAAGVAGGSSGTLVAGFRTEVGYGHHPRTSAPSQSRPRRMPPTSSTPPAPASAGGGRSRALLVARRLFDTGSFFGVGVPEAVVVTLLAWFLLGPAELFRLAKQAGSWLGELRTYVGQVARQYESALDDDSTRKAIDGIRETQRTVAEISSSWRSVTDSLRDPLALGTTFQSTFDKYGPEKGLPADSKDAGKAFEKNGKDAKEAKKEPVAETYPDLESEPESIEVTPGPAGSHQEAETETAEELEAKRRASREAASSLYFSQDAEESDKEVDMNDYLARLDGRLAELDDMAVRLQEIRADIVVDRNAVRASLQASKVEAKAAPSPAPGRSSAPPAPAKDEVESAVATSPPRTEKAATPAR